MHNNVAEPRSCLPEPPEQMCNHLSLSYKQVTGSLEHSLLEVTMNGPAEVYYIYTGPLVINSEGRSGHLSFWTLITVHRARLGLL